MFLKKIKRVVWWVLEYAVYKRQLPVAMAKGCLEIPTQGRVYPGPKSSVAMFLLVHRGLRSSGPGCYVQESKDQFFPHSRRP